MSSERDIAVEAAAKRVAQLVIDKLKPELEACYKNAVKTCFNCHYFQENPMLCRLYNQVPPPRVVAFGCVDFLDGYEVPY